MRLRPNIHNVTLHGPSRGFVRIPVRVLEANSSKRFFRTREHVIRGHEGESCSCANAEGALEVLGGDGWEFIDNQAYQLFKNKKGQLFKAIVYAHNQSKFQEKYDKAGKKAMLSSPDCEGWVTLSPPTPYTPKRGVRSPLPPSKEDGSRTINGRERARGSLARLERRGIAV